MARTPKKPAEAKAAKDAAAQDVAKAVTSDVTPSDQQTPATPENAAREAGHPPTTDGSDPAATGDDNAPEQPVQAPQQAVGTASQDTQDAPPQSDKGAAETAAAPKVAGPPAPPAPPALPEQRVFSVLSAILHNGELTEPGGELLLTEAQHKALRRHVLDDWENGRPA